MKKRSLLTSIILASLLTLTAVFTTVTWFINETVAEQNMQATQTNAQLTAEAISFRIRDALSSLTAKLMLVAPALLPDPNGDVAGLKFAEKKLIELLEKNPDLYSAWVIYEPKIYDPEKIIDRNFVNNKGKVYQTFDVEDSLINDETQKWYHRTRQTKEIFFDEIYFYDYRDGNPKKYVGSISLPLLHSADLVGVYGVDVLFSHIFAQIAELRGNSPHFLLDAEGVIVGAADVKYIEKKFSDFLPALVELAEELKKGQAYFFETVSPFTQKKSLVGFVPIKMGYSTYDGHLFLYVEYAVDSLFGGTQRMLETIRWLMIIGGLLFITLLFFLVRRLTRPIKQLTTAAQQIATGDLNVTFTTRDVAAKNKNNEIDDLQTALSTMVKKLNQTRAWEVSAVKAEAEKEQALETARVRTEFFARMSHELRTPMNAVVGFTRVLNTEPLTAKQHKLVVEIEHSAALLLDIVNGILDLSRLDAGKLSLLPVHYDFQLLLAHLTSMTAMLAEKKSLRFNYQPATHLPHYLYGDDLRLKQILINVLNNAVKFTERGTIELTIRADTQYLFFAISDTGIGIKTADLPNLFNVFQQVNMQTTRQVTGTGLGLAICKSLVNLMDGSINVHSVYGTGTTFTVCVPYTLGDGEKIIKEVIVTPEKFNGLAVKILVVDDNETNLQVAQQTLSMLGLTAETVLSGKMAIEKVKANKYDLIFMDHMMPEMDGVETLKRLRGLGENYQELPIIALTANAITGAKELFLAEGFDDFLSKPLDFKELQRVLQKFLRVKVADAVGEKIADVALAPTVLRSIVAGGVRRLEKLSQLFTARDARNYAIEVHALKSVAATVHEMELAHLAATHEKAGNENDWATIDATFNELAEKYVALIEKVKAQIPAAAISPAPKITMSPAKIAELFRAINRAANDFSIKPINVAIAELATAELSATDAEKLRKICNAAELLDYDTLETL